MKRIVFFVLTALIFFGSCSKEQAIFTENGLDKVFAMSQHSLNRNSNVSISFLDEVKNADIGSCVQWSVPIKGEWELTDPKTIVFKPETFLPANQDLELTVDVGKLLGLGAKKIGFTEKFHVGRPFFYVNVLYPTVDKDNSDLCSLDFSVNTDVEMLIQDVAPLIGAEINGQKQKLIYDANAPKATEHHFQVTNIEKLSHTQYLIISYDANPINIEASGEISRNIPAKDLFEVLNVRVISDKSVAFTFSENLDSTADIREFISVTSDNTDWTYTWRFDKNTLTFTCSAKAWPEDTRISILPRLKSSNGHILENRYDYDVVLGWHKPSVFFADNKVIIPSEGKPVVGIVTQNLSGVIVEAIQIQQSNMLQFLQVNNLSQSYEMTRVGQSVWRKSFDFDWNDNMRNLTVTRGLDLSELVKKYPEGMFQLKVTFAKRHSKYEGGISVDTRDLEFPSDFVNFERYPYDAYWDNVDNTVNRYDFWNYDDNPNHPAYYISSYNSSCVATQNVIVSNLAISAKVDALGNSYLQTINLITGEPEKNAEIKVFNYSQNLLEQGSSDTNGRYIIAEPKDNISFIQARSGNNYAYIKLSDSPLSTSNFQVDGIRANDGIKGFVYGERGVWRPGDSMHLCLIIQDIRNAMPSNLPITFTLEDPMGKVVDKQILTDNINGFYKVTTSTNEADATGTWIARFKTGNNVWTKNLKIESVIPNKLSVDLQVANGFFNSGRNSVTLKSEWLTGVRASGLKSEVYSRYISSHGSFPSYKDYTFSDMDYNTSTSLSKVWEGTLDENGVSNFNLQLDAGKNVSGMLKAIFETRVYEPSGAFSIESKTFDYSPFSRYVGFKLPKSDDEYRDVLYLGKDHILDIVLVDESGKLINTSAKLDVVIYKLDWRWWWVRDAYTEANYDESRSAVEVLRQEARVANGKGSFKFNLDQWGRYLILVSDPTSGHKASSVVYADYSYWATRSTNSVAGSQDMLLLTVNQDTYNVGENAEITFSANKNASAYITIEKNGMVLSQEVVKAVTGTNTYRFKTTNEMSPNVYAHVMLVQSFSETTNSLPIRMYGIVPIMVEDKTTHLDPIIKVADSFGPNQDCVISISEKNGTASTFTIAVVDEGLLGLTAFKTSNPWDYFYAKESSQLSSYDMFNYVAGARRGELQTLITVGGSDDNLEVATKSAERFKPVVFYFGPFELKKGEKKNLNFTMPEYIGEVRVMAVCGNNHGFGVAEQKVKVKSDIMLSPTLPRTIGVDENIELPVTVFNTTNGAKTINVELETRGVVSVKRSESIRLEPNSNGIVSFSINPDTIGTLEVNFIAKDGSKQLMKSTTEIAVKVRGLSHENRQVFAVKPGEQIQAYVDTVGVKGTKNLSVEIAEKQPIGVEKHLKSLLDYPHGCIEQITSKAFAQLYIHKLLNLTNEEINRIKNSVNSVIARYPKYQVSNGGMGYWQGDSYEHAWGSAYALHFLIEAKSSGYSVDQNLYTNLLNRIKTTASSFNSYSTSYDLNSQAYRLYVLALTGNANVGAMNRLQRENNIPLYGQVLLSLAYTSSGNREQGQKIFNSITAKITSYRKTGDDFSSSIRDLAMLTFAASKLGDKSASERFIALSDVTNKETWLSTQEAAWVLIAASQFYAKDSSANVKYELTSEGERITNELKTYAQVHDLKVSNNNRQTITFKNNGQSTCFVTVLYNSQISTGSETQASSGISLQVNYAKNSAKVPVASIGLGDTVSVSHTVTNLAKIGVEHLVLTFPIPTGWEVSNERLGGEVGNTNYSYLDIRDDVVYVHFDLKAGEARTFNFMLTATYGGEYFVPASSCEAMYDYNIRANTVGTKLRATLK